ncbi:MAG: phosphate ABC transporter substrate-binding protein PstS [Alphaproteobacteria bacterium]|nr:phosphate ABC transporter substrate-binding protein PstS [Alphaproteobacteria bacterium]MDE2162587.1 phosphate ABC transporter substrate-binding protein PstS [Alphaproteobacteria bacterium]MDE2266872.1 phosphate ABC transporter substrate-binding protein PstS [Alphaproteobacteria bacterium]
MKKSLKAGLGAFAGLVSAAVVATGALAANLNGAGGTAIYPVLSVWAQDYQKKTGDQINYQAIGSGGGIAQIKAKTVDFANSDKPLMHEDLSQNHIMQFPQVIISIVPVVHLPGIKAGEMVLDGPTLADIYLGKITKWNDPAIKKLNPKVPLPNMAILVVHRSDGSGTTFNFTNYLGKVSPEWKSSVGSDTSVSWPTGIGGKGNAGVAGSVQQTVGSIGYVEYAYVMQNHLTYMDMVNAAGARVKPTMEAFQTAAANADFSKVQDFYLILTDQPGAGSWPITAATYMLMRTDYAPARNKQVLKFLDWALKDGQEDAKKLDYVPFPEAVVKQIEASWTSELHAWP